MMKMFGVFILLVILSVYYNAFAQSPSCPCDTLTLSNGTTGKDILNGLCPNGKLGNDTESELQESLVIVFTEVSGQGKSYQVDTPPLGEVCYISQEGQNQKSLALTPLEASICRTNVIEACNLLSKPIPTLSEWGLISAATGLGLIVLFFAVRRRRVMV